MAQPPGRRDEETRRLRESDRTMGAGNGARGDRGLRTDCPTFSKNLRSCTSCLFRNESRQDTESPTMARSSFIGLFLALSTFSPAQARDIPLFDHYKGENIPGNHVWAKYAGSCHRWESVCDEKGLSTSHDHKGQMCVSCEVKYLNDNERLPYKLIWQEGKGWLGPDHQPYDTAADVRKRGVHPTEMSDTQTAKEWGAMPGIWVMDTKGNLYTSVEQSPGHFNHSTFLAGGPVVGAGQVIIEKGQITYLNNLSGHYRPTVSDIAGMIDQLHIGAKADRGVRHPTRPTPRHGLNQQFECPGEPRRANLAETASDDRAQASGQSPGDRWSRCPRDPKHAHGSL